MLTGKALNVTPDYSPKAEELLSKAVKLEPTLVEAWNQLVQEQSLPSKPVNGASPAAD